MNKILFCCLFLVISIMVFSQQVDTIIHETNYTSYYNYKLHEPLIVTYTLYHGGGTCNRSDDRFITNGLPNSATAADYSGSDYDEGHLANSKDFAYDCNKQQATFRFYNCVPQTPKLNRGIWKHYETLIREQSNSENLYIVCGSFFGTKTIGSNRIAVPDKCWKIVYSMDKKKVIYSLIFPNDNSDKYHDIDFVQLKGLVTEHYSFFKFTF